MKYRVKRINAYYHSYFIAQWSHFGLFWHTIEYGGMGMQPKEYQTLSKAQEAVDYDIEWRRNSKEIVVATKET